MSDDGFINLRIVENLLSGNGLVFNAGERVEAGTSQLWLGLLAVFRLGTGGQLRLEWIAVVLGIACSVAAVVVMIETQRRVWTGTLVPAGVLAWISLASVWDFSSSGLETPLLWLWLTGSFGVVAVRAVSPVLAPVCKPVWMPILLGLGPLIRPDAALYSAAFLLALTLTSKRGRKGVAAAVATAAALPMAYEVFRAGYFATLVPNTALAKEAGGSQWGEGLRYLADFLTVGLLPIPYAVMRFMVVHAKKTGSVPSPLVTVWTITWSAALVHALWVVRVGGDFMHARMFLPDWLLVILPVAALPVALFDSRRMKLTGWILVLWCLIAAGFVRAPASSPRSSDIFDERSYYVAESENAHPVTTDDHALNRWIEFGREARRARERGADVLIRPVWGESSRVEPSTGGTFVMWPNIGMLGFVAGSEVHVVDPLGLADPVASRSQVFDGARIGHAKRLPLAWAQARFIRPDAFAGADAQSALKALSCPPLSDLLDSVTSPLTPRQFVVNMFRAPALTRLRIPDDPAQAVRELC